MAEGTKLSSPHSHTGTSVAGMMLRVGLALVPGIAVYSWHFGYAVLVQCLLAGIFALVLEWLMIKLRGRDARPSLSDGSAVVTALIFALCLSPYTPWWINFCGIAFAIIVAKHIYGGLGCNTFNPAMTGYVFVLLCFPAELVHWPTLNHGGPDLAFAMFGSSPQSGIDGSSGATALLHMESQLGLMNMVSEIRSHALFGRIAGAGWEWVALMYLLGGISLLLTGIIKWYIPVSVLFTVFLCSMVFNWYDSDVYAPPLFHLFAGGTMLAAFFVATDPVTSPSTRSGMLMFGVLIGLLAFSIRTWGAFPDGIAFAILIANACVPLIDHLSRPRVVGEAEK